MKKLLFSLVACFAITAVILLSQSALSAGTVNSSMITAETTMTSQVEESNSYGYWVLVNEGWAIITVEPDNAE